MKPDSALIGAQPEAVIDGTFDYGGSTKSHKHTMKRSKAGNMYTMFESLENRRLMSANLVADFDGFYPTDAFVVNGVSFFSANDGVHGTELWKSDGTEKNTWLVRDISAGKHSSLIYGMQKMDDGVIFISQNSVNQKSAVWFSDGTSAGTRLLAQFDKQDSVQPLAQQLLNRRFLFKVNNSELWASDGTAGRTRKIATPGSMYGEPGFVGNRMMFGNEDSGSLWSTDGTAAGTFKMPAMQHGLPSDMGGWWSVAKMSPLNGRLLLFSQFTYEIWSTDGTIGGTKLLAIPPMYVNALGENNGLLYFAGINPPASIKTQVWITDGTPAGTAKIEELNEDLRAISAHAVAGKTYIFGRADDDNMSIRILASDGTAPGTSVIGSITSPLISKPITMNGKLYFFAQGEDGVLIYSINPDDDQISEVKQLSQNTVTGSAVVQGSLYFTAWTDGADGQLWKTDGTENGTVFVKSLPESTLFNLDDVDGKLVLSWTGVSNPEKRFAEVLDPATDQVPVAPVQATSRLLDGTLRIYGTEMADAIQLYRNGVDGQRLCVNINGVKRTFALADVKKIIVYGYGGSDRIEIQERFGKIAARTRISGGSGNDTISTASGQDTLFGDDGNDRLSSSNSSDWIHGGDGDDSINSGAGNDTANGDDGRDSLTGGDGRDILSGGQDDRDDWLFGGSGEDVVFGQAVYDIFYNPGGDAGTVLDDLLKN